MAFNDPIFLTTTPFNVDWNGETWLGIGALGEIEAVEDTVGESSSLKFSLSAVPSVMLSLALGESARNKGCRVYDVTLHAETCAVLDASLIWAGILDQMPIVEGGETSTVGVTSKHMGSLFARVKPLRYTDGDQQLVSPGDTSLRFIPSQATHQDIWPAASFGAV